ncbi:MAG: Flagellar basal-body rod protein FlgC [Planctomycetes bacterium ADurb.Bin412]|nr:MAG: Flagellar basal-body rod protein FlgC [Planctomycetes bacterium ADurb.Bin412]
MMEAIDISTSGLVAQRIRMNTIAMNMANIDSFNPDGTPYQRRSVEFQTGSGARDRSGQGVHVAAIRQEAVYRKEYDPSHPYADADGYVSLPGIDYLTEMTNMMLASRAYEANVTAVELSKSMLNSSLRLLG